MATDRPSILFVFSDQRQFQGRMRQPLETDGGERRPAAQILGLSLARHEVDGSLEFRVRARHAQSPWPASLDPLLNPSFVF